MKTRITISLYIALQVPKVARKFRKVFDGAIPPCDTMTWGGKTLRRVDESDFDIFDEMISFDYFNLSATQSGWSKVGVDNAATLLTESGWEEINE